MARSEMTRREQILLACAMGLPLVWAAGSAALASGTAATSQPTSSFSPASRPATIESAARASAILSDLVKDLPAAVKASQEVLQGRRDPNDPSCASMPALKSTDKGIPKLPAGDARGGVGERLLQASYWERKPTSPAADYEYFQKTIRPFMEKLKEQNKPAFDSLAVEAARAEPLAAWLAGQTVFTADLKPALAPEGTNWPAHCLHELDQAISRKDLPACQRWSAELAAATAGLLDLHRWVSLLAADYLDSLDLQAQSESMFEANKQPADYSVYRISCFPGGSTLVAGVSNFFEVERQGEGYFRKPDEFAALAGQDHAGTERGAAGWLTPDVRLAFIELRRRLSADNQALWDRAATTPFERSYLTNMLYRLGKADVLNQAGVSLERFDRRLPKGAQLSQLMDVLTYRASLGTSGMEWGDRFDGRLMKAGGALVATTPADALEEARKFQFGVYGGGDNYEGLVLTLRRALDTGHMDCIRATDMIAAVCRDAGWPGFLAVRWDRGVSGHSVAAMETPGGDRRRIDIVDGLFGPGQHKEVWPDSYFRGHGDLYAVELLGRGLDSFVVLETYILHGPNAGRLTRRAVPYLPGHDHAEVRHP